jgi:hypothetical protein
VSLSQAELDNRFSYHAPKPGQNEIYNQLRAGGRDLAELIDTLVPDSREKSTALTQPETALFWANAGVARND